MGKICLCLTGKTLARDLEILDRNRKYVDLVELRADCLAPDERLSLRRFPEMAGVPVILSIRRVTDGGCYIGGEGARITLLAKGLAYANADRRRNFAYVDLEEDLNVPSLEEVARAFGTRIIRSWYNLTGVDDDVAAKIKKLRRVGDEIVKAALTPGNLSDMRKVYRAFNDSGNTDKIFYCMGEYAAAPNILAKRFGSLFSYAFPGNELDPKELSELYRFHQITPDTKIFASTDNQFNVSSPSRFFNTIFGIEQIDAVHVPIPADSLHSVVSFAEEIGISGFSVTMPNKEKALSYLNYKSEEVRSSGACNLFVRGVSGWSGHNTDAAAFSESLLAFIKRNDLRRQKVTIIGAGGSARAIAGEVHRLKGKALILNRTAEKARLLAEPYRFAWAALDNHSIKRIEKYSNLIIQASSAGMPPDADADPVSFYKFSGRETVMDIVCRSEKTPLLKRAEASGCRVLDGNDMLVRQFRHHYTCFVNKEFPPSLISRVEIEKPNGGVKAEEQKHGTTGY